MYILCIETTSTNCSVAITGKQGGYVNDFGIKYCLDLIEDQNDSYSHGERLHVFIDEILKRNKLKPADLSAVAVSSGPGSYTGLRIGVASAKGLCYSLNIPLISIDTLTALARQDNGERSTTISFLDARRMEVYARVFNDSIPATEVEAVILEPNSFNDWTADQSVTFIGTGVGKFEEISSSTNSKFVTTMPSAITMCDLALDKMIQQDIVEDIAYFEPLYLKEFKVG